MRVFFFFNQRGGGREVGGGGGGGGGSGAAWSLGLSRGAHLRENSRRLRRYTNASALTSAQIKAQQPVCACEGDTLRRTHAHTGCFYAQKSTLLLCHLSGVFRVFFFFYLGTMRSGAVSLSDSSL